MLVLTHSDVASVLSMDDCIAAIERAMKDLAQGAYQLPLRTKVQLANVGNRMALMPARRGGDRPMWSLKEVVVTPDNATRRLDPHQGAVLLHEGVTGRLLAMVDATSITAIRTAAATAVATRALANPDARRIAVVGAGHQAATHIDAMRCIFPDARIVLWSRTMAKAAALASTKGCDAVGTAREAVLGADVVCVTTNSSTPVIDLDWLEPGVHVNAVGSSIPTARELDGPTMAAGSLFVDRRDAALVEAGDYVIACKEGFVGPDHIKAEIGDVLIGKSKGRTRADEITIYKSLGIAIQDLAAAELAVELAQRAGRGVSVDW